MLIIKEGGSNERQHKPVRAVDSSNGYWCLYCKKEMFKDSGDRIKDGFLLWSATVMVGSLFGLFIGITNSNIPWTQGIACGWIAGLIFGLLVAGKHFVSEGHGEWKVLGG